MNNAGKLPRTAVLMAAVLAAIGLLAGCTNPLLPAPKKKADTAITAAAVTITGPAKDSAPVTTAATTDTGYTCGAVSWNPNDNPFKGGTVYTASVTLTANKGYTFTGLTTATINGNNATVTNNTGKAVTLSFVFAATITTNTGNTGDPADTAITAAAVTITGPSKDSAPVTTAATGDTGYTCGAVSWTPNDNPFKGGTVYTATVTLTAKEGYTFTGLTTAAINGNTATVSNNTGAAVTLSHTFAATNTKTVTAIAVKTQPSNLTYTHGDTLDLSGLAVTLTHDDNTSEDAALADFVLMNISENPANGVVLSHIAHNGQPIKVSYGEKTADTGNLMVSKANPSVTWPTAADITYGAALSTSALGGGVGAGVFAWTDWAIIPTITNNGYQVTFTPTDSTNYNTLTQNVNVTVNKANPSVTWPTGLTAAYGQTLSNISLPGNGTSSPAGTFTWTTPSTSVGALGTRSFSMTFTPTDTANYNTVTNNVDITVVLYRVSFNTNGGGSIPDQLIATDGTAITRPSDPTKSDHVFDFWYVNEGLTVPYNFATIVTGNITLYAKWISQADINAMVNKDMVWVAGGSFQMGQNGDGSTGNVTPVHTVTLSGFYIGKYEVTQEQYEAVIGTTITQQQALATTSTTNYGRGDDYPVYYVSWYDALVFCNKLSMAEGLSPAYSISNSTDPTAWGTVPTSSDATWNAVEVVSGSNGYRLPTEAQWEYAAKGGPSASNPPKIFSGSDNVEEVAWYSGNNGSSGTPTYGSKQVGTKAANELGIHDMSGNVWEWCWDWYGSYTSEAQTDPVGTSSGSSRVRRGGHWGVSAGSANRDINNPNLRSYGVGFRLLCPAQ